MFKTTKILRTILLIINCIALMPSTGHSESFNNLPVKGMVTMIDLGAKKCIPCKMMAPIIKKMEKVYAGKAAIVFIDVWEHHEQAQRFRIRVIPTQIFFDKDGKEVFRHQGFMGEKEISGQFKKMGIEPPSETKS